MGTAHQRLAAKQLLRERAARRDGRRLARFVWCVFWDDRGPGICIARCRRNVGPNCSRSSGSVFSGGPDAQMILVVLPSHLRTLAGVKGEIQLEVEGEVTRLSILDALETRYPMLRGTIREHVTG